MDCRLQFFSLFHPQPSVDVMMHTWMALEEVATRKPLVAQEIVAIITAPSLVVSRLWRSLANHRQIQLITVTPGGANVRGLSIPTDTGEITTLTPTNHQCMTKGAQRQAGAVEAIQGCSHASRECLLVNAAPGLLWVDRIPVFFFLPLYFTAIVPVSVAVAPQTSVVTIPNASTTHQQHHHAENNRHCTSPSQDATFKSLSVMRNPRSNHTQCLSTVLCALSLGKCVCVCG